MRFFRLVLYFLLFAYLGALVFVSLSSHEGGDVGLKLPLIKGRSIQWEFKVKEIEARRPKYIASAKKLFVDSSGRTFLSKNVVIEIPSSSTVIKSEKCVVSPGKNRVEFPETVEVESETGIFKGEKSLYLAKKDIIRLEGGIEFKIGDIQGKAERGRMKLDEGQTLLLQPEFSSGDISLKGGRVLVMEREMRAYLRGKPATMKSGGRVLMAPLMEIDMEGKKVNSVFASRGGRVVEKGRRLVAKELKLWSDGRLQGRGVVGRWGEIRFSAEEIRGKDESIVAEASSVYQGNLSFVSKNLSVKESSLKAWGGVKGRLGNASFSCQELYSHEGKRSLFGEVRIVKDENVINASKAIEESGKYLLSDATIITPDGYRLTASKVIYEKDSILLEGGAGLKGENFQIAAPRITISLQEGKLSQLEAQNPRKIILGQDTARCMSIRYKFQEDKAILEGGVVLNSKKHGEIKGERIVVNSRTGSFEIQGRGRTSSEIKQ